MSYSPKRIYFILSYFSLLEFAVVYLSFHGRFAVAMAAPSGRASSTTFGESSTRHHKSYPQKMEPKVFKLPTFVIFLEFCCCRFFIRPAWWTVPMTTSSAVHSDFLVVGISVSFGRCHGGNPQSARPIRRHRDVPFSILIDENPADGSPGELGALLPLDPLSI